MIKLLAVLSTLITSSLALANSQNCTGGGGNWHIKSRGITVLGSVRVTFTENNGTTWKGWGDWGKYRKMTLRKKIDGQYQIRQFKCWSKTHHKRTKWGCKEKGVQSSFRFICSGGDWYNLFRLK
tara:strand:+ start:17 stop:388 length:372 start_codon:yes stop_codon:yes gene_type:complete